MMNQLRKLFYYSLPILLLTSCNLPNTGEMKDDAIKIGQDAKKQQKKQNLVDRMQGAIQAINQIQESAKFAPILPPYEPSKESWILADRLNPKNFISLNLKLPSDWKSTLVSNGVTLAQAPEAFKLDQNPVFDFLLRDSSTSNPFLDIFAINPKREGIFLSLLPHADFGIDYPGGLTYIMLHEGFHLYIQFLDSRWAWNGDDTGIPREDSKICIDSKNSFVQNEYKHLWNVWDALEADASLMILKMRWKEWADARAQRILAIPTVNHDDDTETNCSNMDRMYHRVEGLADYVSFSTLIALKKIKLPEIKTFYQKVISLDHEGGFYASGATLSFILEKIDPSGSWKKQVIEDPNSSLEELVSQQMESINL